MASVPQCPYCLGYDTVLLPGRVVYECIECGETFTRIEVVRWQDSKRPPQEPENVSN